MTDTDAHDEHDGFVFENDAASQPTHDETERSADRRVIGALVVVAVIVLVVFAAVVIPPVASTVTGLFDDGSANVGNTTSDTAVGASTTAGTSEPDSTASTTGSGPAETNATAPTPPQTNGSSTPTAPAGPTATTTPTTTATRTTTPTTTRTANGTATDSKTETANGTTNPSDRSPRIESFTVTDRSDDGTATFDVEWTVTDPERGLTDVTVRLVTDLDSDARTVERRRFDAGGKETTGNTTFTVPDGSGSAYEVRIEATDNAGNTAFELARVVADGDPDESVRGPKMAERPPVPLEAREWISK